MKTIYLLTLLLALAACTESSSPAAEETNESTETGTTTNALSLINPCSIISTATIESTFDVAAPATLEMFERQPYDNMKQCQFIWSESEKSTKGSQIMVDIMVNMEGFESPTPYSRMLEMDLLNGLLDRKQQLINPTAIGEFGKGAYYWVEGSADNVQKIKFQVNENYMVQILFNSNFDVPYTDVKQKLIALGKTIKQQLEK